MKVASERQQMAFFPSENHFLRSPLRSPLLCHPIALSRSPNEAELPNRTLEAEEEGGYSYDVHIW